MVPAAAVVGVVLVNTIDIGTSPFVLGGFGGFLAGTAVSIALVRRRLATDDELLRRQLRLGFDPEHPWRWLRPGR
ncbi:MAG TPA: hypothetical protein VNT58_07575 [Gaiellaceae bacterium]|nr:hypothetical protein [Gaiellaceae bacterium]